jgi:hypothetical protein
MTIRCCGGALLLAGLLACDAPGFFPDQTIGDLYTTHSDVPATDPDSSMQQRDLAGDTVDAAQDVAPRRPVPPALPPYAPNPAAIGPAAVLGSVKGESFAVTHAWGMHIDVLGAQLDAVIMMPHGGSCDVVAAAMPKRKLYLQLCNKGPGEYAIGELCELKGVSYYVEARISANGGDPKASSGTIQVDAFDTSLGGAMRGSFIADFDGETLAGSFDTVGCGSYGS